MKALMIPVAGLAIAAALPAAAQPATEPTIASALQAMQRMAVQYGVLLTRSFVDLTYDSITIEQGTGDLILSGLRVYPELDWDRERRCQITVDRLLMVDGNSLDTLGSAISLSGVNIPPICLQPPVAETMGAFGYDGITLDSATIDFDYHIPSSSAGLAISASVADAAEISLSADFDYLWFRVPITDPSDPGMAASSAVPVARLAEAELVIENRGLWQALEPMLAEQMGGDFSAIPEIVQMTLGAALTEGGVRSLTGQEAAFIDQLSAQLTRFVREQDRIVITASPEEGSVLLTEELMDSPDALIAALDPVVSASPAGWRRVIAPDELAAALSGGSGLDAETRLRVGEALVTGLGAPRAVSTGRTLLAPLAEEGDARAALLTAQADREAGALDSAYAMALRALAGGEAAAIGLADEIEAELPLGVALTAQAELANGWPGADRSRTEAEELLAAGDISGIARRAQSAATGRAGPRHYADAYYWASLAAAAGDRGAAALRDRLDARLQGQPGWAETVAAEQERALETWTGGLAATIAARTE